eukprot:2563479-Amphidinium_carterae.1
MGGLPVVLQFGVYHDSSPAWTSAFKPLVIGKLLTSLRPSSPCVRLWGAVLMLNSENALRAAENSELQATQE